jgi:hypothetical protein
MKPHPWTIDDVQAGRLVCKAPGPSGAADGWFATWCYKIGWSLGVPDSKRHFCMISMSDGMVHTPRSEEGILEWLKRENMQPMREEWWRDVCRWMHGTLGLVASSTPGET